MSTLSKKSLTTILESKETYKYTVSYLQEIENENQQVLKVVSSTITDILHSKTQPLLAKMQALRLYKDLFLTAQFGMLELVETDIDKYLMITAQYKKESNDENRGQNYFVENQGREKDADVIQKGKSFLTFTLEMIKSFAEWYPIDVNGGTSKFKSYYDELLKKKVTFSQKNRYIKQQDRQKFQYNLEAKWGQKDLQNMSNLLQKSTKIQKKGSASEPNNQHRLHESKQMQSSEKYKQRIRQLQEQVETFKQLLHEQQQYKQQQGYRNIQQQKQQIPPPKNTMKQYQRRELQYKQQLSKSNRQIKQLESRVNQLMVINAQLEIKTIFKPSKNLFTMPTAIEGFQTTRQSRITHKKSQSTITIRSLSKTERSKVRCSQDLSLNKKVSDMYKIKNMKESEVVSINLPFQNVLSSNKESFIKANLLDKFTLPFKAAVLGGVNPFFQTKPFRLYMKKESKTYRILCENFQNKPLQITLSILPNIMIKFQQLKCSKILILPNQRKPVSSFKVNILSFPIRYLEGVVISNNRYEIPLPITLLNFVLFTPLKNLTKPTFNYPNTIYSHSLIEGSDQKNQIFLDYFKRFFTDEKQNIILLVTMPGYQEIKAIMDIQGDISSRVISLVFQSTNNFNRAFCNNLIDTLQFLFL